MTEAECSIWYKAVFGLWELIPISGCSRDPPTGLSRFCPICSTPSVATLSNLDRPTSKAIDIRDATFLVKQQFTPS